MSKEETMASLVSIEQAVAAVVAGAATVADVAAAARAARTQDCWDAFGGWSDQNGRARKPSPAETDAFRRVLDALHASDAPQPTGAERIERAGRMIQMQDSAEAEQARLDECL